MIPIVTSAVGMKGKSAGEVSQFTKENLENQLSGVEGVASVSAMGMISDNIQIVLSQKKIDEINDKISSAISSQLGEAKEQINSGISAANSGKEQIASGKTAVIEGQKQASQQIAATRSQLKSGREKLVELK